MENINLFEIQKKDLKKDDIELIALNYNRINEINRNFFRPKPIDPFEIQKHLTQINYGHTE